MRHFVLTLQLALGYALGWSIEQFINYLLK